MNGILFPFYKTISQYHSEILSRLPKPQPVFQYEENAHSLLKYTTHFHPNSDRQNVGAVQALHIHHFHHESPKLDK